MATSVIVLVADRDDPKHGEITVVEGAGKAERLVETLLEAGFEQERIRVFTGAELNLQISHRPVVALVEEEAVDSDADEESSADQDGEAQDGAEQADAEGEKEPFVQNGVKFSSLFRGA